MSVKDILTAQAMMAGVAGSEHTYDYFTEMHVKRGPSHKEYKNKNANIEYYVDEKGNLRRRKKGK